MAIRPGVVGLLAADLRVVALGAVYLKIVMVPVVFRFFSMIAARALAGAGDTRTPMYVRLVSLPMDIGLTVFLVFGLGPAPALGVAGAALATAVSYTFAGVVFAAILFSGRYPVQLRFGGVQFDAGIVKEIMRVSAPLAATRLARAFGRFPFLFVLAALGTPVVAAYAVGRRVMLFALMPAWGYSTAASTLVGQHLGFGDDAGATEYGWEILRIALATQLLLAAVIVVAARPIAIAFGIEHVGLTVTFIRIFGIGVAGYSVARTMRGGLRGAGDMRWPFYGTFIGTYLLKLPLAALALPVGYAVSVAGHTFTPGLGLGLGAVFAAILAELYLKALVNTARFHSGAWKRVARHSATGPRT